MRAKRITSSMAREWVLKKHYAKRLPSISFLFGVYDDFNVLRGICSYGKPASNNLCVGICGSENSSLVYELNRLVIDDEMPKNTASFLIGYSFKYLKKSGRKILVSYADTDWDHIGYIYQATNWIYTGKTKARTDINSGDGKHSRHYDKSQDYSLNRKQRSAKHRYVYFVGNKKDKKHFSESLNYPVLPYPKGETRKYDASYKPIIQYELF